MRSVEEGRTKDLLNAIDCHEISAVVAEVAGKLQNEWARKGRTLTLGDMMVAAVALEQGCSLATDNRKDFPMRELELYPLPSE
jgi:predicted nucleic acid-binding protein